MVNGEDMAFDLQSVLAQIMGDEPIELTKKTTTTITTETVTAPAVKRAVTKVVTGANDGAVARTIALDRLDNTAVAQPHPTSGINGAGEGHVPSGPQVQAGTSEALSGDAVSVATLMSFPKFTEDNLADTMDIRNYATLCRLRVRKWVGKRRDKNAARNAERDSQAVTGAFSTYKRLFAGTEDKLRAVNSVLDAARTRHYQMTLPWSTTSLEDAARRDGPRLLANTLFMEYISEMGAAKQQMDAVLDDFERSYPSLLVEAKKNLGKAFDITQYPPSSSIRGLFALDFEFSPIPAGADYKGLPQQQVTALATKLNKSMQQCMENALRDVWDRAHTVVAKIAERLGNQQHAFHDTLISNAVEIGGLLKHLNATNDKRIEEVRQRIEADLCKYEPEVLRKDVTKRALIAKLAGELLSDMEARGRA